MAVFFGSTRFSGLGYTDNIEKKVSGLISPTLFSLKKGKGPCSGKTFAITLGGGEHHENLQT